MTWRAFSRKYLMGENAGENMTIATRNLKIVVALLVVAALLNITILIVRLTR